MKLTRKVELDVTSKVDFEIGRAVSTARRDAGKEQAEIAKRVGISQSAYSRLECGKAGWTVVRLLAVSKALGVSFQTFIGEKTS